MKQNLVTAPADANLSPRSPMLSPNTQAILLLTAPLLLGTKPTPSPLLSAHEYQKLARHLRTCGAQPCDLLAPEAKELLRLCQPIVDEDRMRLLLGRGFLLSQAINHWQSRAIWVISRADPHYPSLIKARLREASPPVLYGCGDTALLDAGGLAVVDSRNAMPDEIDYAKRAGALSAEAGKMLISGGARGIDQAAMQGAADAGGWVCEVMAEQLERAALDRQRRAALIEKRLVLISAFDPSAGFNVGHAMQRNKLMYALANAALVVASDYQRGGTWAGAIEQLQKMRLVPVYVRNQGETSRGLQALLENGALPWPEPFDPAALAALLDQTNDVPASTAKVDKISMPETLPLFTAASSAPANTDANPAELLLASVRKILQRLLTAPMNDVAITTALDVSLTQAQSWLKRLEQEGLLEANNSVSTYTLRKNAA